MNYNHLAPPGTSAWCDPFWWENILRDFRHCRQFNRHGGPCGIQNPKLYIIIKIPMKMKLNNFLLSFSWQHSIINITHGSAAQISANHNPTTSTFLTFGHLDTFFPFFKPGLTLLNAT
jgi:hypothetical protein